MNAEVLDTKGLRTFGGELDPLFQEDLILSVKQIPKDQLSTIQNSALLLSGGGSYGAFGAGFLNGWSRSGTRPEFKLVTGISTGALIAPLAFVGEDYDSVLQKMYTGVSTEDVAEIRGISALWNDSLADSAPLMKILEIYINEDFIEKVAQE
ncbi:MAG: patatin-like phospholipase family protein, partial [Nitrosopumilaceae archaeon]|nr:patatin-like phospholipase family protein [Nitrosopumilaceae archaeon]